MRTGFREHLMAGLVALIMLYFAVLILSPKPPLLMLAASFAFMLGTLLPDIDAPFSIVRRAFAGLFFLLVLFASLALVFIFHAPLSNLCASLAGLDQLACTGILLLLALALPVLALYLVNRLMPFHRGVLHGFFAALIYGAFLSSLAAGAGLARASNIFITLAGMLGYVLHILLDIAGDILPGRKR